MKIAYVDNKDIEPYIELAEQQIMHVGLQMISC